MHEITASGSLETKQETPQAPLCRLWVTNETLFFYHFGNVKLFCLILIDSNLGIKQVLK